MVRSWCGLTEEVLDKTAESALAEKGCFYRDQDNSGFNKVDLSSPPQSPRRRLDSTRWPQVPRIALALPLVVWLKMASAPAPSLHATAGEGMAWRLSSHPVNRAWGHTFLQGKMGHVVFSRVAMCPATPWELHYQKEEAEIGYWETSVPTASYLRKAWAETWSTL